MKRHRIELPEALVVVVVVGGGGGGVGD